MIDMRHRDPPIHPPPPPIYPTRPPSTQRDPQIKQVEYRSRWVPFALGLALAMYISCFLCQFHSRWVANADAISIRIWALLLILNVYQNKPENLFTLKVMAS